MYARHLVGRSKTALPVLVVATTLFDGRQTVRSVSHLEGGKREPPKKKPEPELFDITSKLKEDFWKSSIFTGTEEETQKEEDKKKVVTSESSLDSFVLGKAREFLGLKDQKPTLTSRKSTKRVKDEDSADSFKDMAFTFASLLTGTGGEAAVQRIVKQARESAEEGDVSDKKSLEEMLSLLKQYAEDLKKTADKFLGDVDLTSLFPTSLFYYVEREDEVKNPSWKRRMHRFFPGIDIRQMDELNDYLQLANLTYADTVEEIQQGLENNKTPYEVVLVDTNSRPNRPSHFIAVKRKQTFFSPYLEVLLCVRGTKTIEDALTDLLCDYKDYRGGTFSTSIFFLAYSAILNISHLLLLKVWHILEY